MNVEEAGDVEVLKLYENKCEAKSPPSPKPVKWVKFVVNFPKEEKELTKEGKGCKGYLAYDIFHEHCKKCEYRLEASINKVRNKIIDKYVENLEKSLKFPSR